MTFTTPPVPHEAEYDPATMPAASLSNVQIVWYRRPWLLITLGIAIVIAASIISDLPHHATPKEQAADLNVSITRINTDLKLCNYSLGEAFKIYDSELNGTLSSADQPHVKTFLNDDLSMCSFTSGQINDLSNIQFPGTPAGQEVQQMLNVVYLWSTGAGLSAIDDIQYLIKHPGNQAKERNLAQAEKLLITRRAKARSIIDVARHLLGEKILYPTLVIPPAVKK